MKKFLIIILYLFLANQLKAQDNNISYQFKNILFQDLVDTLEKEVMVKIYYTDKWVDSLYLNINSENDSLVGFLNKALTREGFTFIITEKNKVILSKGYSIKTNFKEDYNAFLKKSMIKTEPVYYSRPVQVQADNAISDEYKVFKIGKLSGNSKSDKATLSGVLARLERDNYIYRVKNK